MMPIECTIQAPMLPSLNHLGSAINLKHFQFKQVPKLRSAACIDPLGASIILPTLQPLQDRVTRLIWWRSNTTRALQCFKYLSIRLGEHDNTLLPVLTNTLMSDRARVRGRGAFWIGLVFRGASPPKGRLRSRHHHFDEATLDLILSAISHI